MNKTAQLCAKLDGMIAHLYGLTESEFAHILSTFPLVGEEVKSVPPKNGGICDGDGGVWEDGKVGKRDD